MTTDYAHGEYATERRTLKAVRLEGHLRATDVAAALAAGFTPAERRATERAAGVRTSSDETWELVVRLLRSSEGRPR